MPSLAILTLFLVLNYAGSTAMLGWALALLWVAWRIVVRGGSLPRPLAALLLFPSLVLLTALPGALFRPPSDAAKDVWYLLNPIVYIVFGYLLFEGISSWQKFFQPFIVIGILTSIYGVVNVFLHRNLLIESATVEGYRQIVGFGFGQAAIPIVLLSLARREGLKHGWLDRSRLIRGLLYVFGTVAILVSLARTIIVVLVSGWLLSLRPRQFGRKLLSSSGAGLILLIAVLGLGGLYSVARSNLIGNFFLEKVLHTASEVDIEHYDTFSQINDNWRGFEAYRALQTYASFSPREKIMGGGAGTFVDLGFAMPLSATDSFQLIPITHNGYAYLLVKTGVVGILLFGFFIFQIFRMGLLALRSLNPVDVFTGYVLIWTAIDFAMTQAVITGIYNKAALAPNLVLLGSACASLRRSSLQESGQGDFEGDLEPNIDWSPEFNHVG